MINFEWSCYVINLLKYIKNFNLHVNGVNEGSDASVVKFEMKSSMINIEKNIFYFIFFVKIFENEKYQVRIT